MFIYVTWANVSVYPGCILFSLVRAIFWLFLPVYKITINVWGVDVLKHRITIDLSKKKSKKCDCNSNLAWFNTINIKSGLKMLNIDNSVYNSMYTELSVCIDVLNIDVFKQHGITIELLANTPPLWLWNGFLPFACRREFLHTTEHRMYRGGNKEEFIPSIAL